MKKILLVEDNREVRETTAEIIELANYKVLTADNGKAGVELALKELPNLVICDIMMPILDGYAVFHLLSKHPQTASIPFIFLTAKSEKADVRKGMQLGADDYISKPFDGNELLDAIEIRIKKHERLKVKYSGNNAMEDFLVDVQNTGSVSLTSADREVSSYSKKTQVYREGQRPRAMYLVVSGKVKTFKTSDEGKEFITGIYGPNEYFGYTAMLEEINYTDEAQALEETSLMLVPREDFLQLVSCDLQVAQTFIKIITENILEKEERLLNLAYSSLRKKVAYGIIHLLGIYSNKEVGPQVINLSRENLAQSIGVATESLIRTLGDFKDEGLVEIAAGKLIIIDRQKLANLLY